MRKLQRAGDDRRLVEQLGDIGPVVWLDGSDQDGVHGVGLRVWPGACGNKKKPRRRPGGAWGLVRLAAFGLARALLRPSAGAGGADKEHRVYVAAHGRKPSSARRGGQAPAAPRGVGKP